MPEVTRTDCSDLTKVLVRAAPGGAVAAALGVQLGRAARTGDGTLVVRTTPDAWLLLAPAGTTPAAALAPAVDGPGADEFASVFEVTHGYALVRLTGPGAAGVLARLCAIDLTRTPDGAAFRSLLAGVVATVVRDDDRAAGQPSYLVQCDRSYGRYLVDVLTDAASY